MYNRLSIMDDDKCSPKSEKSIQTRAWQAECANSIGRGRLARLSSVAASVQMAMCNSHLPVRILPVAPKNKVKVR